jgi:hypothetical protein
MGNATLWILIVVVFLVVVIGGYYTFYYISHLPHTSTSNPTSNVIGGQRDSNGCLGPAGYSWNSSEKECVREWENTTEGRYQVTNFQTCVDAGYPVAESNPRKCSTPNGRSFSEVLD